MSQWRPLNHVDKTGTVTRVPRVGPSVSPAAGSPGGTHSKQNDFRTWKSYLKATLSIFKRNARKIQPALVAGVFHFDRPGDVRAGSVVCQKLADCTLIIFFSLITTRNMCCRLSCNVKSVPSGGREGAENEKEMLFLTPSAFSFSLDIEQM